MQPPADREKRLLGELLGELLFNLIDERILSLLDFASGLLIFLPRLIPVRLDISLLAFELQLTARSLSDFPPTKERPAGLSRYGGQIRPR